MWKRWFGGILSKYSLISTMLRYHSVEKLEFCSRRKNNSWNQFFSNFFKTLTFTNFPPKMCESKFPSFPHCAVVILCNDFYWKLRETKCTVYMQITDFFSQYLVAKIPSIFFAKKLLSRNFWQKKCFSNFHTVRYTVCT